VKLHSFEYPPSQQIHLESISETVPVYQGHVRINREIRTRKCSEAGGQIPGELILKGSLQYQACDDKKCFIPQNVPLEWRFRFEGLDWERAPADLQHKPR
jgi:hypothetical protein